MWASNILQNCMGLRTGETVLALVDEPLRYAGEALCAAAEALGAGPAGLRVVPAPPGAGARPGLTVVPDAFLRQVREADVIVALFSALDLSAESPWLRAGFAAFRSAGRGRWAAGAGIDRDVLEHELAADYAAVAERTAAVAARLTGAGRIRLVTAAGTDLTLQLGGRPIHQDSGLLTAPGAYGNLPAGEAFVAPLEQSAEGRLVVDLSLGDIPLDEPVTLTFRQGRATVDSGGRAAAELKRRLGADPRAWTLGEFGVGTNPGARIRGRATTDEKVLGTAHVALGGNRHFGGANPIDSHYDCVVGAPRIEIDGVAW